MKALEAQFNKKDLLYRELPCIWDGKKYVLFSPYAQKIARLSGKQLENRDVVRKLKSLKFFGKVDSGDSKNIVKIGLILTTDCNLSCKYCYVEKESAPNYMAPDFATRAIKEMLKPSTKQIYLSFFGGEPTLNMKALQAAVDYTQSLGLKTKYHITTNGVLNEKILNYLIKNRFTITVSMDGSAEINDFQRPLANGGGSSKSLEKTIQKLVHQNILFQVRATVTQYNVTQMPTAIKYWDSMGVKYIHLEPVCISKKASNSNMAVLDREMYIKCIKNVLAEAERRGLYVINSAYMNLLTPSRHFCSTVGGEKILFTPDGGISVCYKVQDIHHPFRDFVIGRYNPEEDSFVINKSRSNKMNRIEVDLSSECKKCFAKYLCGGGCPYRNYAENGRFSQVGSWLCSTKKVLLHDAIIRIYKSSKDGKGSPIFGSAFFENNESIISN